MANLPQQKGPLPAPKAQADGPLVKARVRPGNKYGGEPAGSVVEVAAAEIKRVPHALISLDDEEKQRAEAAKPKEPNTGTQMFRALKKSAVLANEARQRAKAAALRQHFKALGVEIK